MAAKTRIGLVFTAAAIVASPLVSCVAPQPVFKNCTLMNQQYPHGVGKPNAVDRVAGRTKPVTTFYRNEALYNVNTKSDRDRDGIACEKR